MEVKTEHSSVTLREPLLAFMCTKGLNPQLCSCPETIIMVIQPPSEDEEVTPRMAVGWEMPLEGI